MSRWYLRRSGKEHGPFSITKLRELAATSELRPDDLLRREDAPAGCPAKEIEGLFDRAPTVTAATVVQQPAAPQSPSQPPPLPFMQPPPLPLQSPAVAPSPVVTKEIRLNPNTTFLLGIWVGVGLCAVAFTSLAVSGRFGPFVRWLETTAKDASAAVQPSSEISSPVVEAETDPPATSPIAAEREKVQKPTASSDEFREGFAAGQEFGRERGGIAYAQGRKVMEFKLREGLDGVRQYDNPYPEGSDEAEDWLSGWEQGARAGLGKYLTTE